MPRKRFRLRNIQCDLSYRVVPHTGPDPDAAPHVLLIHGHSSRMGEFDDLVPHLAAFAHIYMFDQPCCGASSDVSVSQVRAKYKPSGRPPALYYLRELSAEFVNQVVAPLLPAGARLRVAGGSLGGNLSLMLTERGYTWLKDAVVWSPGSAWAGDVYQAAGAGVALGRAKERWGARRDEFLKGTYCEDVVFLLPGARPQPWYWYWDGWGGGSLDRRPVLETKDGTLRCDGQNYPLMTQRKASAIEASFAEIEHDYNAKRAAWHWELAGEQLGFSHRASIKLRSGPVVPRIALIKKSTRFMAGEHDDHAPANLHDYTKELYEDAARSVSAPLRVAWESVTGSGHSIHNERPDHLAKILVGPIDA